MNEDQDGSSQAGIEQAQPTFATMIDVVSDQIAEITGTKRGEESLVRLTVFVLAMIGVTTLVGEIPGITSEILSILLAAAGGAAAGLTWDPISRFTHPKYRKIIEDLKHKTGPLSAEDIVSLMKYDNPITSEEVTRTLLGRSPLPGQKPAEDPRYMVIAMLIQQQKRLMGKPRTREDRQVIRDQVLSIIGEAEQMALEETPESQRRKAFASVADISLGAFSGAGLAFLIDKFSGAHEGGMAGILDDLAVWITMVVAVGRERLERHSAQERIRRIVGNEE